MSKCWYCNEELTTANYCDKHIGICTKCYNSMFKVSNEFVKCLTDKIADLKAKLIESEKRFQEHKQTDIKTIQEQSDLIGQLKQQLAKKEKEIDEINKVWVQSVHDWKVLCKKKDQEKISFAVEQLEKVKGKIQHNILFVDCDDYVNVIEEIDNQIKLLKEGK